MPQINRVKIYKENSFYHIYGRGNNKAQIFFDDFDYQAFKYFLKKKLRDLDGSIVLDSFCLMPNHYHLLISQTKSREITKLMRSVCIRYTMYLNKKYHKVGRVFEGTYRASLVPRGKTPITRQYILDNPKNAGLVNWKNVGKGFEL